MRLTQVLTACPEVQHVLEYDRGTGAASMCLSPNNTCAAVVFKRGTAMELQISDVGTEDKETFDIELTATRCGLADVWSCLNIMLYRLSSSV